MRIGIPREKAKHEHRVGLTPFGVSKLAELGCEIFVEHDAGRASRFTDEAFAGAGGKIVYSVEEVFGRADLVLKVAAVTSDEARMMPPGMTAAGFMSLAIMPKDVITSLADREVTLLGWESVEDAAGAHPVLRALSEIAGHMTVQWAAHLLQYEQGGRGILLGKIPGIPPATVVVLGAGAVGWTAARHALAAGAHVIVLDEDLDKLRRAIHHGCEHAVTAVSSERNVDRFVRIADVLIGAVLSAKPGTPRGRSPWVVRKEMVQRMKPGAVIIDLAIDHGGCVETSRPTSLDQPTFVAHGVTHCCVPNITSNAPRTASRAMTLAAIPYLATIAEEGFQGALASHPGLARGVYLYRGRPVHELAAMALGTQPARLEELLGT